MPSAVASLNDAFDFDEPARKKAPRNPRPPSQKGTRKKGKKPRRFAFDAQRVARYGAIGMSATISLAIMVNALMLQKGRHPAPLFGKSIALGAAPVPAAKAPPAPSVPAPDEDAAPAPPRAMVPQPTSRQAAEDAAPASTSAGDPIGQLIEGRAPAQAAPKTDNRTVLGAQRALAKLGFALKPNGTLGPQTRKAIEAFERDHHLPVKGELSRRVVKVLEAESKLRID